MAALVGIALESPRRAHFSRRQAPRGVLRSRNAQHFLSKCSSDRLHFSLDHQSHTGDAEFGCKYCYARYAHEFMELRDPLDFERRIFVKTVYDPERFRDGATGVCPKARPSRWVRRPTPISQPSGVIASRGRFSAFLPQTSGFRLGVTTKSQLVARDIDLFREISQSHFFNVHMTVTTVDAELARAMEPLAPRPDLRLAAVRKLARNGIRASVFRARPLLPLINDTAMRAWMNSRGCRLQPPERHGASAATSCS